MTFIGEMPFPNFFVIWNKEHKTYLPNNSIQNNILLTMKIEEKNFFGPLINKKMTINKTLGLQKTYTFRKLQGNSNLHPFQKYGTIKTLTEGPKRICESASLKVEIVHI